MLLQLAWRNLWRNGKRSAIILISIALGLSGGLFSGAVMMGMGESMIHSAINRYLGHIELHAPGYRTDARLNRAINNWHDVEMFLSGQKEPVRASSRTLVEGMAASAGASFGVHIVGVEAAAETLATRITEKMQEGTFLGNRYRQPVVIGRKLAERLKLHLKSRLILTFQDRNGDLTYMAARISGIFKTESSMFDESTVYVPRTRLQQILGGEAPLIHEVAIRLKSGAAVKSFKARLKQQFPRLDVTDWKELAPELAFMSSSVESFTYLFVAIIIFALLFGITNTMLMAVVERTHELGILMAVGMKKSRLFIMIILESILLSLTGGLLGMGLGAMIIGWYNTHGIDLSAFATGLETFGSGSILYPFLPGYMYVMMGGMILVAANIAAIMPALKAARLQPARAVRIY
ncbi:MAG: ABC transporter permease [Calditrichaeota bacterium]|nr:MAG: ABC transporter permease [Calditrichota bacterium]